MLKDAVFGYIFESLLQSLKQSRPPKSAELYSAYVELLFSDIVFMWVCVMFKSIYNHSLKHHNHRLAQEIQSLSLFFCTCVQTGTSQTTADKLTEM